MKNYDEASASPRRKFHHKRQVVLSRILGTATHANWTPYETPTKTLGFVKGYTEGFVIDSGVSIKGDDYAYDETPNIHLDPVAPEGWRRILTLNEPSGWDSIDARGEGSIAPEKFAAFLRPTILKGDRGFIAETCGWHKDVEATTRETTALFDPDNAMAADPLSMTGPGQAQLVRRTETTPGRTSIYPHGVPEWVDATDPSFASA